MNQIVPNRPLSHFGGFIRYYTSPAPKDDKVFSKGSNTEVSLGTKIRQFHVLPFYSGIVS